MPLVHPAADVWTLLADIVDETPDAPAFIHGERALSFAELLDGAARAAQGLADLGVGPGDRVALWLPNVPAYPILYFACVRLGAIAVAVNTRYRAVEVADIVGRSGAKVLACAPGFRRIDFLSILADIEPAALDRLAAIIMVGEEPTSAPAAIERLRRVPFDRLLSRPAFAGNHALASAPCNIFTTSGTTSAPKFVLHRQGAIAGHAQQVARVFGFTAPDTLSLAILPLCGVFGFNQTLATLAAGKPSVLVESYEIDEIARLIAAPQADHDVRQRRHVCPPARHDAGPLALPLDQVGGLRRVQCLARGPARAGPAARSSPGRAVRHERGAGALRPPAAQGADGPAQAGRRPSDLAAWPCARARSGNRRAAGSRPARRAGMRRPLADGGLLRQRGGDGAGDDGRRLCPHRRPRPARRARRLHLPQPHGRRAAALRLPGQPARDRDPHPEAAGHRRLPDHRRAAARRACAPCRS